MIRYQSKLYRPIAAGLPILVKPKVYHVGSMNPAHKGSDSLEGAGLSVSMHPEEWREIARLGADPVWLLTKPGGSFLHFYRLTKRAQKEILEWGIYKGYIVPTTIYRAIWPESGMRMDFTDKDKAIREIEDDEEAYIKEIKNGMGVGTASLARRGKNSEVRREPEVAFDILTTIWVEDTTDLDGVWWNETLDVWELSAPRGVIVPSRIDSWQAVELGREI